jgi:hypothetical protein
MQLSKAQLMCSYRGRLRLAREAAAAQEAAQKNSLQNDPWFAPTSRLKGRVDWDGMEYIQSAQVLDALGVPVHAKRAALYRRLNKVMQEHGWEPIRVKLNGVEGGGWSTACGGTGARQTSSRTRRCLRNFRARSTRARLTLLARSFRGSKWTRVGLSHARSAL